MDRASLSPPTTPGITTEDVDRLLEAAKAALRYLDDLDCHAPEGSTSAMRRMSGGSSVGL